MKISLGRSIVLVDDYDEAFAFYEKNFYCEKLYDETVSDSLRFLHIKFNGDHNNGIWFLEAKTEAQRSLVGKQTGGQPLLVIYTDDCYALYEHVRLNHVTILEPIETTKGSRYFHCADLYGNRITVVELIPHDSLS